MRRQFQPTVPEGQEVDSGQLDREFENNYQTFLTATGLTDSEYRVILEEDLTRAGLASMQAQGIETPQEQVEVRWIRLPVDPQESGGARLQPAQVAQRLEVEDFATVASEVSVSEGYSDRSGYVGWVPEGAFPELDPLMYGDEEGKSLGRRNQRSRYARANLHRPDALRAGRTACKRPNGDQTDTGTDAKMAG